MPILLLTSGCSTGTGARWYAPATWFSHAPASAVDKAAKVEDAAREKAIKAAQRNAHSTGLALVSAAPSRPVAAASDFNASTVALLDQAAGPLPAGELDQLRATVAGLLSENAEIRARAEAQRRAELNSIAELSRRLATAEEKSDAAGAKLRGAFERENALANEARSTRALFWIACGVAALLGLGWLYVRVMLGGVPSAIGRGLTELRMKHPDVAATVTPIFDSYLSRHEQTAIARSTQ